jgi:Family of unknown function (DUF6886)
VLFHVSEDATIAVFHPRPAPATAPDAGAIVWAIDESHLANYLLPRDCPRVTFGAGPSTTGEDLRRFAVGNGRIVVIEADWLRRVCACTLHVYELPSEGFRLLDRTAGYWVTTAPVAPLRMASIDDLPSAIVARGAELRIVHRLWPLHDAIAQSTLAFSMIRMRHAQR